MLRTISRRAALLIPALRRLYESQESLKLEVYVLRSDLQRSVNLVEEQRAKLGAAERHESQESLKLEVYVLRSDLQRSVNLVEEQRAKLGAAERQLQAAERQLQIVRDEATLRDEISGTKYRLMGGLASLSTDVKALRQL